MKRAYDLSKEPRRFTCLDCKISHRATYGFGLVLGTPGWYGRCLRCLQPERGAVACECDAIEEADEDLNAAFPEQAFRPR